MKKIFLFLMCVLLATNLYAGTNYPGSLDSYSTKGSGDTISEAHINDPQSAIVAVETKLGTGSSTATTNTVLRGTGAGATAFGQVVNGDITNTTIDLTTKVIGTLPVANGGTAITTSLIKYGTHTGNGSYPRSIAHGLGSAPSFLMLISNNVGGAEIPSQWISGAAQGQCGDGTLTGISCDATNIIVTTSYGNKTNSVYYWVVGKSN